MTTLNDFVQNLLAKIPTAQQPAASALIVQYGPQLQQMAIDDAWAYIRRIMAGDLQAVADLDSALSNDAFLAKVKANTAAWQSVANYNIIRDQLRNEILLRAAPIVLSILLALVGL